MINNIIFILILNIWIILDIYEDYFYIIFNNAWHKVDAAFRVINSGYLFYLKFGITDFSVSYWLIFLVWYWLIFDMGLNKKRRLNINYIGNHNYLDKNFLARLRIKPTQFKTALLVLMNGGYFTYYLLN